MKEKKVKRNIRPLELSLCSKISDRIILARHDFVSAIEPAQAYDLYIQGLKFALEDLQTLKSVLDIKIRDAEFNKPLPF